MKKFLSLMLTLALIITTLALPITASAADIDLMTAGNQTITISYDAQFNDAAISETNKVKPGDSFTVDVKIAAESDTTFDASDLSVKYDGAFFNLTTVDLKDSTNWTSNTISNTEGNYVKLSSIANVSFSSTATTVATLTFNVANKAVTSESYVLSAQQDTLFYDTDGKWYRASDNNLTDNAATIYVEANTVSATIDGSAIVNDNTYYKSTNLTLAYSGSNVTKAEYKLGNAEAVSFLNGASNSVELTEAGTYTVTVQAAGLEPVVYTFTYVKEDVNVKLTPSTDNVTVNPGQNVTISVKITGLPADKKASMVKFKAVSDNAKVTLASASPAEIKDGFVVYGDAANSASIAENAIVANLVFNVAEDAKFGDVKFTFSDEDLALETSVIDPSATKIVADPSVVTSTIIPTANFATLSDPSDRTSWTGEDNQPYDITVAPVTNATVKYTKVAKGTSVATDNLATFYANSTEATDNKIPVNSEETIYVVAKIGSQYQLIGPFENGAAPVFYDATAPVVNGSADMTDWVSTLNAAYNHDVTAITAEDSESGSGVAGKWYSTDNGATLKTLTEAGEIAIEQGTSVKPDNTSYAIFFKDRAGNLSTGKVVKLMLDGDAPTITDTSVGVQENGKKELIFTAADATSNVTVTVTGPNGAVTAEADGKYYAAANGNYTVTATDAAGNTATHTFENVVLETLSSAAGLSVSVVKGKALKDNGFIPEGDEKLTAFSGTNGTFTYAKIKVMDMTNATSTVTLDDVTKEGEFEVTTAGEHTVVVTTTNSANSNDVRTATYKFKIVTDQKDMPSVDGDKRYNMLDFALVRKVVGGTTVGVLPNADSEFTGGIFSGDVNGDFTLTAADYDAILESLRAGKIPGTYTFDIMNYVAPAGE